MQRVAIDINSIVPYYLRGWTTGIGRTTMELVEALNGMKHLPFEIVLYSQNMKGIGAHNMHTQFDARHLYLPYRDMWNRMLSHTHVRQWITGCNLYHIPHNFDYVHRPENVIITLHDCIYFAYPEKNYNHAFARKYYPQLANNCRGILTCSEASKLDIMKYMDVPEDKIAVTPWGYNCDVFYPRTNWKTEFSDNKEDTISKLEEIILRRYFSTNRGNSTSDAFSSSRRFFLCTSCNAERKNTPNLIRAYAQFAKQDPSHELVLVWKNPNVEVREVIRQHHLAHRIHFLSDLNDTEMAILYCSATALFFPSRYEGFGLPILESMACGTPVVTCNNSSLPEVGGNVALYVDPDDIDGMSILMEQFENGSLNKTDFFESCLQQAAHFSWTRCAEQTVAFYLKNLQQQPFY